jgi:hypothetical protein
MRILQSNILFSTPGEHSVRFQGAGADSDSMNADPAASEHDSDLDSSAVAEVEKLLRSPAPEKRKAVGFPASPPAGTGVSPSRQYTPCALHLDNFFTQKAAVLSPWWVPVWLAITHIV